MSQAEHDRLLELMQRRQRQILVHSYIYYEANSNIISDMTFTKWSQELYELQRDYPDIAKETEYYEAYQGFDGASGFDLPYRMPHIVSRATHLMEYAKSKEEK